MRWVSPNPVCRPAFSLAEMMIALVILGLGLLFIAAALPAGVEYTRRTAELSMAESGGNDALDTIAGRIRTSRLGVKQSNPPIANPPRRDPLVRPRTNTPAQGYPVVPDVNAGGPDINAIPRLKVRPLIGMNIDLTPGSNTRGREVPDTGEEVVRAFATLPNVLIPNDTLNLDLGGNFSLFESPVFSAASRVYPPISADLRRNVATFIAGANLGTLLTEAYAPIPLRDYFDDPTVPGTDIGSESRKLTDRRIVWTALYRRVAYSLGTPNAITDGVTGTVGNRIADPLTYEFIVFVCRRQTENHRFARQDGASGSTPANPLAATPANSNTALLAGSDRMFPEPWLIAFEAIPQPIANTDYSVADIGRNWNPTRPHASTLRFTCSLQVGAILPVGSYVVPALNDQEWTIPQRVGFVPNLPDSLPIYEVVDRPNATTVVVRGNGVYPWVQSGSPRQFLCWVIPPAFTSRNSTGGQPVWEKRSPVISVVRRVIRLPEAE